MSSRKFMYVDDLALVVQVTKKKAGGVVITYFINGEWSTLYYVNVVMYSPSITLFAHCCTRGQSNSCQKA